MVALSLMYSALFKSTFTTLNGTLPSGPSMPTCRALSCCTVVWEILSGVMPWMPIWPELHSTQSCRRFTISCFMLLMLQDEIDYGFAVAQWNHVGLTDGEYELVVHVVCESSGLSFAPPGIDDYYSAPVRGVRIYLCHVY